MQSQWIVFMHKRGINDKLNLDSVQNCHYRHMKSANKLILITDSFNRTLFTKWHSNSNEQI